MGRVEEHGKPRCRHLVAVLMKNVAAIGQMLDATPTCPAEAARGFGAAMSLLMTQPQWLQTVFVIDLPASAVVAGTSLRCGLYLEEVRAGNAGGYPLARLRCWTQAG